jgi:hypothetical protein
VLASDPLSATNAPLTAPTAYATALPAHLPATGARLLVTAGSDDEALRPLADTLGATLVAAGSLATLPPASQAAVVLCTPPPADLLASLHGLLADKGRLLFPGPVTDELVVALSEQGFVLARDDDAVVHARREPFFVRAYQDGDEAQILPLFARSFFVERSVERWAWEYRENPYGNRMISQAFTADGRLVAHYAGYPVQFWNGLGPTPERLTALQVGDTMTDPAVRQVGRGPTSLLGRTVRHYYARFCRGRVAFNFGVNTGNIQRFSMSFVGAERLEDLPYHVRPTQPPVRVEKPWWRRLAGWRVERVEHFDRRFDELFARVRGDYRFLVERDARYLEWRYARCPDQAYHVWAVFRRQQLVGWSVLRHRGERGERLAWGDGLFDRRHPFALPLLFSEVLAAPQHRHAEVVETWLSSRPGWWSERVRALGFTAVPEPQALGFVYVPHQVDPTADLRAGLFYTMGDSDLF